MNIHEEIAHAILEGGDWWYGFEWYDEHELPKPMWRGFLSPKQIFHTLADPRFTIRKKKKYIHLNGVEVPEPVREPLKEGQIFYLADVIVIGVFDYTWHNTDDNQRWLSRGLIHLNREDAETHIAALVEANNGV